MATAPPGVYVEPKGLTVTLHFRRAPEHEDWVLAFAERQHADAGASRWSRGGTSASCGPRSTWTRGPWSTPWWPSTSGRRRRAAAGRCRLRRRRRRPARLRRPRGAARRRRPAAHGRAGGRRRPREPGRRGRRRGPDGAGRHRRGGVAARAGRGRHRGRRVRLSAERPPAGRPTSRPRCVRAPRRATPRPVRARAGSVHGERRVQRVGRAGHVEGVDAECAVTVERELLPGAGLA